MMYSDQTMWLVVDEAGTDNVGESSGSGTDNVGESSGSQSTVSGSNGFVDIHVRSSHCDNTHPIDHRTQPGVEVDEQLRQRIRELETTVHRQNADIQGKEILERNNIATMRSLIKVKAENEVLQEDREHYNSCMQFYKRQAEEETTKKNMHEERIQESNMRLITNARDSSRRIKDLEQQVVYWKKKFENTSVENQNQSSSQAYKLTTDTIGTEPKRRRHSFFQSRTNLPSCRNCMMVFDQTKPYQIECRFHRSFPQPLKAWKKQLSETSQQFANPSMQAYKYWPCCEKVGLKEPPGCLKLRAHDIIYLDEE